MLLSLLIGFCGSVAVAQPVLQPLQGKWEFKQWRTQSWMPAVVPGTVHMDLNRNKKIPDPFFRDNEKKVQWVDSADWEYRIQFTVDEKILGRKYINLVFDGLDTYADVFINDQHLLKANNMFRRWIVDAKAQLRKDSNMIYIRFHAAKRIADSLAKANLPQLLPDHPRVYARKAQFQFGWDWGPVLIGAGIWKNVWIDAYDDVSAIDQQQKMLDQKNEKRTINWSLVQMPDEHGVSFSFQQNGIPVYMKGANWIPAHAFLPAVQQKDYRRLLQMAKDANMNMIRVWGGGIYESDEFYDICDELGIWVWQDFMFAGGMVPGDTVFISNVREEVIQQIKRLRHHPCIILWCGNNEISEAWHNWGWQKQFNIHGSDSAKVWKQYQVLFNDSLRSWINEYDCTRPYIESSPQYGWGRKESIASGDSHYWGLWWGLQDWEVFRDKTGRFVSEYGMQAMPSKQTIEAFTLPADRSWKSPVVQAHQKANEGSKKLNHYLTRYFIDSARLQKLSLNHYAYLTQCMQAYILRNTIAVHRSKFPYNMGSLLWQLNDCWPVTSWSIIDFEGYPKAAWYAVKDAFANDNPTPADKTIPKEWKLENSKINFTRLTDTSFRVSSTGSARFVYLDIGASTKYLSDNYFDLEPGDDKVIYISKGKLGAFTATFPAVVTLADVLARTNK